jgi:DNA repair exonuclease SbcCD nuclease subunit
MSKKALLFSDLHIHAHKDRIDRLDNCIEVLNWIFKVAAQNQCDYIFFLGDLFHERAKIDVKNYLKTFEVFMNHMIRDAADRDMYLLVGNHDMYHKERWDINSIKPLSAIPRVHIVETPQQIKLGDLKIDWMPHTDNPVKELESLKKKNNGAGDILLGHMSVHGALLNLCFGTKADVIVEYDNDMVPVDASVFKDWKMTFLGHYHGAQQINDTVEYIGSPLQLTFGEAFQDKHIVILDLETLEKTYIKNDFSPKHLIVTPQDIRDENYNLNGNFVRVAVESTMSNKDIIDLKREIAQNHQVLTLDAKPKEKKIDDDKFFIENAQAVLLNIADMLQKYATEKGIPQGLDANKIFAAGHKCLERTKT